MADTQLTPTAAPAQPSISSDFTEISDIDQEIRRLTVSRGMRNVRERDGSSTPAPMLRLQGAWLKHAGFGVGVPVIVQVSSGRLVIEVAEPECVPHTEALATIARVAGGVPRRELDALVRRLKRDRIA